MAGKGHMIHMREFEPASQFNPFIVSFGEKNAPLVKNSTANGSIYFNISSLQSSIMSENVLLR